jgi:hypothetical protein
MFLNTIKPQAYLTPNSDALLKYEHALSYSYKLI